MSKYFFDWLVIDLYDGNYICSRWCYWCDKNIKLNEFRFIWSKEIINFFKIKKFIIDNDIKFNSISFNLFWNFLNFPKYFFSIVKLFEKFDLLKSWKSILLYWKVSENIDLNYLLKFGLLYWKKYELNLWIDIDLWLKISDLNKQLNLIIYLTQKWYLNNFKVRWIIQKPNYKIDNKFRKQIFDIIKKLEKHIDLYYSYYEPKLIKTGITFDNLFSIDNNCLYLVNNLFYKENNNYHIEMLNISSSNIRFHWPSCLKNNNLIIWNLNSNLSDIVYNMQNRITFLKDISKKDGFVCKNCLN